MVIELTPEQEARVQTAAQRTGKEPGEILTEAAVWLSGLELGYDEALERSIEQADRGDFISEEEMQTRLERMMQPR